MPQFDFFSFFVQIFWFSTFSFLIYLIYLKSPLKSCSEAVKIRSKLKSFLTGEKKTSSSISYYSIALRFF